MFRKGDGSAQTRQRKELTPSSGPIGHCQINHTVQLLGAYTAARLNSHACDEEGQILGEYARIDVGR